MNRRNALDVPDEPDEPSGRYSSEIRGYFDRRFGGWRQAWPTPSGQPDVWIVRENDGCLTETLVEVKTYGGAAARKSVLDEHIYREDFFAEAFRVLQLAQPRKHAWYARISPQKLTSLAVLLAGRERAALATEWRSHLSGETGSGLPSDRQVREAAGFVLAAIRCRLQDAAGSTAGFVLRPVDSVLVSRTLSNLFVLLATLAVVTIYIRHGGIYELADNLEGVAVVWGAAFGLIHVGRQWRDVKPPKRKPRDKKQLRRRLSSVTVRQPVKPRITRRRHTG